jgi:hypothetical protein
MAKKRKTKKRKSAKKTNFHTGTFFTGMVGPKRRRGRPTGSKGKSASTSGLVKAKAIYVKV